MPDQRRTRYACELKQLCSLLAEGPKGFENRDQDPISRIVTLCNFIDGTNCLREFIQELLMTGMAANLPDQMQIFIRQSIEQSPDKELGLFSEPVIKEFERLQILVQQPLAVKFALLLNRKKKAGRLLRRIPRWWRQFEEKYGEPPHAGVNIKTLERDLGFVRRIIPVDGPLS